MSRKNRQESIPFDEDDYVSDNEDSESQPKLEINTSNIMEHPIFGKDFRYLKLKKDEASRPIMVSPEGIVIFEVFNDKINNKLKKLTQQFLISITEPVSRPKYIHTYKITDTSLYAAVSSGSKAETIISVLGKLCKTDLPRNIVDFINQSTLNYGKANLVLCHGILKIESRNKKFLQNLISDHRIKACLITNEKNEVIINYQEMNDGNKKDIDDNADENFFMNMGEVNFGNIESKLVNPNPFFSVNIREEKLEDVKKLCMEKKSTLLSEYDFMNDNHNPNIQMQLKPTTFLRPYQSESLRQMFARNRARSGIIVLPCGAGKTLVGVSAACTVRKRCIVFTTGGVAADQWKKTFEYYTTIDEKRICCFTGSTKDNYKKCDIFITTYSMIGYTGKREGESARTLEWLQTQEWGLIVLDEVHTMPAKTFRSVIKSIKGHCMLGLTATLLREDNKIEDLNFLVGPKLYEADWMELQDNGYIARVQCVEVRCRMDPEFFNSYVTATPVKKTLFAVMNPEKFRRCEYLIKYHEKRGDKIIVFSDNLFALRTYANGMKKMFLEGSTSHDERTEVMKKFREGNKINTIFVSKMADVALDLPEATVLIQISSQGASRRQEAQRLGRITRAKKGMCADEINAYFYTLISSDTVEQAFSHRRQQFLKDQGYAFKVVIELPGMADETLLLDSKEDRKQLLDLVNSANDNECLVEDKTVVKTKKEIERLKTTSHRESLANAMSRKRAACIGEGPPNKR